MTVQARIADKDGGYSDVSVDIGVVDVPVPLTAVPQLSSRPGASAQLYLDFVGDVTDSFSDKSPGTTPAFDTDGRPDSFSDAELAQIPRIFDRVAEKFSPFNLNVTTVAPLALQHGVNFEVVIGGDGSWDSDHMEAGGLAIVGSFLDLNNPNKAFVFPVNLSNNDKFIAEAIAHEAGHGFGLEHHSLYVAGKKKDEYNPGNSAAAPIMGVSYNGQRGLWWRAPGESAHSIQDDMAILASKRNGFGHAPDDHRTAAAMTTLSDTLLSAKGAIETTRDVDTFTFTTAALGLVTIQVAPVTGGMLNARLQLLDADGRKLATADNGLGETISMTLNPGTYRVLVSSHGS
jgi:hypothetical protein